jgi:acid phosphatase type 7
MKRLMAALVLTAGFAVPSTAAAKAPACPPVAYQPTTASAWWVAQPAAYRRAGVRVRVTFRFFDRRAGRAHRLTLTRRLRKGTISLRVVREGRRGDHRRVVDRRSCRPAKGSARRSALGYRSGDLGRPWMPLVPRRAPAPRGAVPPPTPATPAPQAGPSPTVLVAGDVANCFFNRQGDPTSGQHPGPATLATVDVIKANPPAALLMLGDGAYENGTAGEYRDCYAPTWGQFKAITHPVPGNHDFRIDENPYFDYFGTAAAERGKGWYSFDVGAWHIVALNSELKEGTRATPWDQRSYQVRGPGTEQYEWLKADLAAHPSRCVAAMVHRPRYTTSAIHDDSLSIAPLYQLLYDADADLLLAGHTHAYERYPELGLNEDVQPGRGLREFVVGTGGAKLQPLDPPAHHVEVRNGDSYGLLRLTLRPDGYDWKFLPAAGSTFSDEGSTACH